ncbi:hypothetical protein Vadar_031580 [Vaccinium darrowii]|uniref:Uncharacterized protein n=1 Tax=Vaccinium darrowii TaxID=229202 RepID=A0ACB7ZMU5_9ERIC|nr:hypothetical protein Vadar_031580 [Vaccinium darrowii]
MIENLDSDYCSFFDLREMVIAYGYPCTSSMYYLLPGVGLHRGIREIHTDKEVMPMLDAYNGLEVIAMYVEEGPKPLMVLTPKGKVLKDPEVNPINGVNPVDVDMSGPVEVDKGRQVGGEGGGQVGGDYEHVEGDESDPDYAEEDDDDETDSYNPSWLDEDLEGPDDDDIFKRKDKKVDEQSAEELNINIDEWLSDPGDDDELQTLRGSGEDSNQINHPEFNEDVDMKNPVMKKGMKFTNVTVFRKALREWQVQGGYDIKFVKNESTRVTAICKEKKCGFRIHASNMQCEKTFQVKSIIPNHDCHRTYNNHLVTSTYIANKYINKLRDDPYVKVDSFEKEIRRELTVDVSKWQLYRAKKKAREVIDGDMVEQYNRLVDYLETVRLLMEDIGSVEQRGWSFISDRQKGLLETFKDLMPNAEHRFCMRHIYANFRKVFKGKELKDALWRAASAGTVWEHEAYMKKIEKMDGAAYNWLKKIPQEQWCRSHFRTSSRCDILVNNLSESFNSYILEARDKPIVSMLEWIRRKLMSRFQVKRMGMEKYTGTICPKIDKKLEVNIDKARDCFAHFAGEFKFEVDCHDQTYMVDLKAMTCGCRMWDLTGIPCKHAVSAITLNKQKPDEYIHPCYTRDTYLNVYK